MMLSVWHGLGVLSRFCHLFSPNLEPTPRTYVKLGLFVLLVFSPQFSNMFGSNLEILSCKRVLMVKVS